MLKSKKFAVCVSIVFAILSSMVVAYAAEPRYITYDDEFSTSSATATANHYYAGQDITFTALDLKPTSPSQGFLVYLMTSDGTQIGSGVACDSGVSGGGYTFIGAGAGNYHWYIEKEEINGYTISGTIESYSE